MESGYESSKSFAYLEGETICQVNCSISQYNTSVKDGMVTDMGDKLAMVGYNWVRDQYAFIVIDKDVKPGNIVKWEYFGSPLQNGGDNNGFVEATDEYQRYIAQIGGFMALIKLLMVFVVVSLPIAAVLSAITQAIKNRDVKKNEWRNGLEIINL